MFSAESDSNIKPAYAIREHRSLPRAALPKILVCPADKARSVASIQTSMPTFTEAAMTLCARALGLDATSEYVFTQPAIYPFALSNQAFSALRALGGVGRV